MPALAHRPRRAIAYARVSKVGERGDDLLSPELQKHSMESWANRTGVEIVDFIQDLDESGRRFEKRKVKDIIARIESGEADTVVLWKWSRWGRNLLQSRIYIAAVEQAGGQVRAAEEDFDPTTTMGKFTRDQMLSIAELQSNQISDGWKDTHANRRRSGLPHTGAPRFGYTYTKRGTGGEIGYVVNEEERPLLVEAYAAYVTGTSMYALSNLWNSRGLRTRQGNAWNPTSLGRMLDTGFAAGLIRERSEPGTASNNARTLACFDIWREGDHKAVIDMETWERYKSMRLASSAKAPRYRRATHELSGLMICRQCGKTMTSVYSGKHNKHTWTCRLVAAEKRHAPVTLSNRRALGVVLAWLEQEATGGEDIENRTEVARRRTEAATDVAQLEQEVVRLTAKRRRLTDLATDGLIEREDFVRQTEEIRNGLQQATQALERAREAGATAVQGPAFKSVLDLWARASAEQRNALLRTVVGGLLVDVGRFDPTATDGKALVVKGDGRL